MMRAVAALGLTVLACGCTMVPASGPEASRGPAGGSADGTYADVATALLAEANRARTRAGQSPLRADAALNRAAMDYAAELAVRRVLDHRSPTSGLETLTLRITAAGGRFVRAGENLARVSVTADEVPATIITLWMGSASHRQNLVDGAYTRVGTGVARGSRGEWFVVQIYVRPPAAS